MKYYNNWKRFINESSFNEEESHIQKLIEDINEELLDLIIAKKVSFPRNEEEAHKEREIIFNKMGREQTSPFTSYKELCDAYDKMTEIKFKEDHEEYGDE